jgi:hypothetical protein
MALAQIGGGAGMAGLPGPEDATTTRVPLAPPNHAAHTRGYAIKNFSPKIPHHPLRYIFDNNKSLV